jgi:hypothetical protein
MPKGITNNKQSEPTSIPDLAEQFIESIASRNNPFYAYGAAIAEPISDPETKIGKLRTLTLPDLKWYLRRAFSSKSEATITAIADDILRNPALPLKRILGLVTTPTFRQDLTLITDSGYDERSGLYYSPDPTLRTFTFRTDANRDTAKQSLATIFELLSDFPFVDQKQQYAYLATLLTLFLRSSIRAVIPALALDGNGPSVGKGLLTAILSQIAYGKDVASMSVPKSREEWGSKLDSILLDGTPLQVFDNIVGHFSNDDFASLLTAMRRFVRIKGYSKVVDVPVNTIWVLNGNHMSLDSDMAQRLIMCRLQHPDATSREQDSFHIQKTYGCSIETLLRDNRAKYIQVCLDLICGWVNAGAPRRKKLVLAK